MLRKESQSDSECDSDDIADDVVPRCDPSVFFVIEFLADSDGECCDGCAPPREKRSKDHT